MGYLLLKNNITFAKKNMQFPTPVSMAWLADFLSAKIIGDDNASATGINELHRVEEGDLVFVDHPKYYNTCLESAASFIIINKDVEDRKGKTLLLVDNPFDAYCKIVAHYRPQEPQEEMISSTAKIHETAIIYPGVFVGHHVEVGEGSVLQPGVVVMEHCIIGKNVIIQSNTVIGSDAFYYNTKKDRPVYYKKMPSCGRVVIHDDVEIGAGCTIDRGVSHDTILGQGTKLDNHIHLGHDTVIGKNGLFAAGTAVAGMVEIQDGVTVWGQCGISKTLTIHEGAVLLAHTGVAGDLEGNKTYWGAPAQEAGIKRRELVWIKRIPALWEEVMGKKEK